MPIGRAGHDPVLEPLAAALTATTLEFLRANHQPGASIGIVGLENFLRPSGISRNRVAVVFAFGPLVQAVAPGGMALLLGGGVAYTAGLVFFAWDRLRYGHFLWHLCVLAGSICHYFAVLLYALPARAG